MLLEPENDCVTCQITTIHSAARNKHPHTPASHPGETVFLDILPCKSSPGLTPRTNHSYCLILVDSFSRFSVIYGLSNKSTENVVDTTVKNGADYRVVDAYGYLNIERLKADAGLEFTYRTFKQFCSDHRLNLSLAAPKK